ncbi:seven-hairpin glycosidase [Gymnopus androsaceus JB14]|uniref:alpha-1,2-Mannosidase n=1 Tax=Gymnopus androsaceus JB14 TaxID=1447944 RepID=A0A6A4GQ71_9AGAR|nr:seven-hairpin glycosidase [Gymnopus androsaceus JB14]
MAGCSFLRILRDTWQAIPILCASPSLLLLKFTAQTHLLPNPFVHEDTVSNQREGCPLRATEVARLDPIRNTAILTGKTEPVYRKMYRDSRQGIHDELVQTTPNKHSTYIAELVPAIRPASNTDYTLQHKQDHLVCFLAGSLMLGATTTGAATETVSVPPQAHELTRGGRRDWQTGTHLLETCMSTHETATGLAPEIAMFKNSKNSKTRDWYIKNSRPGGPASYDARYMLRNTPNSLGGGYATVLDVDTVPVSLDDKQETFFLGETLKYLYLIFCDSSVRYHVQYRGSSSTGACAHDQAWILLEYSVV